MVSNMSQSFHVSPTSYMTRLSSACMAAPTLLLLAVGGCEPSAAASPSDPTIRQPAPAAASFARSETDSPREASVIAALKEYERAILASDTVTLKRIWADDYTFVNAQGALVTRAQRLANFASGATNVVEALNQRDITVTVHGDMAVLHQLFTLRGTFGGVQTDTEVRGTFVWLWRAGRWQIVTNLVVPVIP
jgi:ketosteroid isomerase-like protein